MDEEYLFFGDVGVLEGLESWPSFIYFVTTRIGICLPPTPARGGFTGIFHAYFLHNIFELVCTYV